jgi:hypothetical protein
MTSLNQISFEQETAAALDWWKNAKFGMFMHWGISAHAGGYWNGVEHPGLSEWIQSQAKIPHREYAAQLCPNFNPQSFNAQKIIGLAKSAGMKYFVVTAKHHDGFAMYDSKYSDFTIIPSKNLPMLAKIRTSNFASIIHRNLIGSIHMEVAITGTNHRKKKILESILRRNANPKSGNC